MPSTPILSLIFPKLSATLPYPHLGIPTLVSHLAAHGHKDVLQLDLNSLGRSMPWDSVVGSSLVGISIAYPEQLDSALSAARRIRNQNPNVMVIAGGSTVTARINSLIGNPSFTIFNGLVAGDGEEPLRMILERVQQNSQDLSEIPNCHFRVGDSFVPPPSQFLMTPDQYPTPLFPMMHYDMLPIRMAKGCFWRKCTFCTYKSVFDGYRRPSLNVAIRQIEELSAQYGTRRFILIDDAIPAKILKELADTLVQRGIQVEWDCSAVFDKKFCDPSVADSLVRGGCRKIYFGFESVNARVLALMGKMNNPQVVLKILENLSGAGIHCHLNVMIGFPTETKAEAQETIAFLLGNRQIYGNFHAQTFSLEEESDVFRHPEQFGILRVKEDACQETSARVGYDFDCASGMKGTQRRYMTMKCQLAYRKPSVSLPSYLRRKMELYGYAVRHPIGVVLNR
jgi:radical SAM superfamily enzyme YgiQ (UPF0313 family)